MSVTEIAPSQPKGPSLVIQAVVLLGMTAAAIGLGWVSGQYLYGRESAAKVEVAAGESHEAPAKAEGDHGKASTGLEVPLPPITTNLAAPSDMWVRMEASVVFDAPQPQSLVDDIHQDLLAFLRTVKVHQIEGASGFQHLKADLEERAKIRSEGHVRQVLIRTLLFE
ncbi:flagellar basal body-associated FliL family protein [Mesorhizobium sp. CGMCC 1.15528]|uniref:Flagellar protein FliL n=1 Tax=Mesorhizobium zhangyense TaxID=1776730 RepID=A0A7C9RAL6_9HYPH|nr:flagellar basal body-associated FliL family protein [Mesorhizobium zhangyense]NGN44222.1 flagellar basal body-associated FliL family protein [Mesorhizobium zhangyense]